MTGAEITRMTNTMRDHARDHEDTAEKIKDILPMEATAHFTAAKVLLSLAVAFGTLDGSDAKGK
jgi:hypothetical protein